MAENQNEIVELETRFWQSMADKDAATAKAMIASQCLVTGPMGAMQVDPAKYEEMTRDGKWTLDSFEFSDVEVIFPADDVAVIAYTVHQKGDVKGKPMDLTCADASTWVREGGAWKCSLHTETILQDAAKATKH